MTAPSDDLSPSDHLKSVQAAATGKPPAHEKPGNGKPESEKPARKQIDMGDYGIHIARDGTWYHLGTPIRRLALVRLLASVLHRDEDGGYSLRTPVERGRITVEDAPFTIVEAGYEGEQLPDMISRKLVLRTNLDRIVIAGPEHRIIVRTDPETGAPRPSVNLGGGLEALILRPVFYDLVEQATERQSGSATLLGLWSGGIFHELGAL